MFRELVPCTPFSKVVKHPGQERPGEGRVCCIDEGHFSGWLHFASLGMAP